MLLVQMAHMPLQHRTGYLPQVLHHVGRRQWLAVHLVISCADRRRNSSSGGNVQVWISSKQVINMSKSNQALLSLQGSIKRDPDGFAEDFQMQWRHYRACMDIFTLKPSNDSREFADLLGFLAQVAQCYPEDTAGFPAELMQLLDTHSEALDSALRQAAVKALILLRNRGQVSPMQVLPLFFRLFKCRDKALRQMLFSHIVADIKGANQKHRDERLNRSIQNFLYSMLQDDSEMAAKKSLAVLTELWRRHVWRDARTVNVIASAALHSNSHIMLAALKFFLGQDNQAEDEASDGEDEAQLKTVQPSKTDIYKANKKGTISSKKKKQAKLKRVMGALRKNARKERGTGAESFAAVQLLNDPQGFAEKLVTQLNVRYKRESWETRLAMMSLAARVVGVHKLVLDEKYYAGFLNLVQPRQRDVTHVLAALVMACHDMVPPDWLQPVLRHLCNQFIHDRARPEEITTGLRTVRELCVRMPLVMTPEMLQDLAAYKKYREKEVSSAARGLIGLFREVAPQLLEKKDRGRGANLEAQPLQYGAAQIQDRVLGAELLQQAELQGDVGGSDSGSVSGSDSDSEVELEGGEDVVSGGGVGPAEESAIQMPAARQAETAERPQVDSLDSGGEAALEEGGEADLSSDEAESDGDEAAAAKALTVGSSDGEEAAAAEALEEGSSDDESQVEAGGSESEPEAAGPTTQDGAAGSAVATAGTGSEEPAGRPARVQVQSQAGSMQSLRRQLAQAKQAQQQQEDATAADDAAAVPVEMGRILTADDFARIRELRHKQVVDATMQKFGLKGTKSKRDRREAEAMEEADAALEFKDGMGVVSEARVDPDRLMGRHKRRKTKDERMQSVLDGREGRGGFGAASSLRKKKTGGLSNKEKAKQKNMPAAARMQQLSRRRKSKAGGAKNFKGRVNPLKK